MQLKKPSSPLAAATAGLLAAVGAAPDPVRAAGDEPWELDTALLIYSEQDRVTVIEPVSRARLDLGDEEYLSVRVVVDSLTGSSASGAIPTTGPQTFTTPSGNATYTTPANQTPLDPSFLDTRVALNLEWEKPLSSALRGVFGLNISKEYDYQSIGASASLARDFNKRNTTLSAGLSFSTDTVEPVGGAPVGLTVMPAFPAVKATQGATQDKEVYDFLLGVTQVLDPKTVLQINYSYGHDSGYLSDPYKLLSVVNGADGSLRNTEPYVYEKRPDRRTRQTVYTRLAHQFDKDVATLSYRYFWDDWGITSHTFDVKYRFELGGGHYLQPQLRYAMQDAADFYRHSLVDGTAVDFASADYRLGELTTTTLGLKYGIELGRDAEFSTRLAWLRQSGDSHPADAIGVQREQDLFPDVEAALVQFSYRFRF